MRAACKNVGQATKTSQQASQGASKRAGPSDGLKGTALVLMDYQPSYAPVSGEILGPDGTVPIRQLPARLKLHRDDQALPADVVLPLIPVTTTHVAAVPWAIIAASRLAQRASVTLNTSALAGLAMAFSLVLVDQTAFAPAVTEDGAKSYTMRVTALPSLVLDLPAATVAHHVMAITTPTSTFLPKLAESAQFLRTAAAQPTAPTFAHNHHLTPAPERATTRTTLASSTIIAAPGAVLGLLAAPSGHPQRQGHHLGTALIQSDTRALAPPTLTRGVTAQKRNANAPSPIVPAIKRSQPSKEAFARIDAATRHSLGARSGDTAVRAQGQNGDWRRSLGNQQ